MKRIYDNYFRLLFLTCMSIFMLSACNNSSSSSVGSTDGNGSSAYFNGIKGTSSGIPLNIKFKIDGTPSETGKNLNDMAWHLITLTVENQNESLATPVALKGLQAMIYPVPKVNRGESVEISDIDCDRAIFSKTGDTCSAYIRSYYDISTGISNPPTTPVQVATNAYDDGVKAMITFYNKPLLERSIGDYRTILPIETKYYTGSEVVANPNQYQLLDMKNASLPALNITNISKINNKVFTLMERTNAESNDPYYGAYSQCSGSANPGANQVNRLATIESECILVYKAAATADDAVESDVIELNTDAQITSPTKLKLMANYTSGAPIPENTKLGSTFMVKNGTAHIAGSSMLMDGNGTLSSGEIASSNLPFKMVNVAYKFKPQSLAKIPGVPNYYDPSAKAIDIADTSLEANSKILTDISSTNPVTVGYIDRLAVFGNSATQTIKAEACSGAWASSTARIATDDYNMAKNHQVRIIMDNNSNGNCGGDAPQHYEAILSAYGSGEYGVYNVNAQGCGDKRWDNRGTVAVLGEGCNGSVCSYRVEVTAAHGGDTGQCHVSNTQVSSLYFTVPQPYLQLSNLQNFTPNDLKQPTFVGRGGQSLSAALGTQSGAIAQSFDCTKYTSSERCIASGSYGNESSSTNMLYNIGLNAGDLLDSGIVNFTRSDGYDLSTFVISH